MLEQTTNTTTTDSSTVVLGVVGGDLHPSTTCLRLLCDVVMRHGHEKRDLHVSLEQGRSGFRVVVVVV